jgi:hypothetical protein
MQKLVSLEDYQLLKRIKRGQKGELTYHVVCADNHVPAHDKKLHENFCAFLTDLGSSLASLTIAGDLFDIKALSSHEKGSTVNITLDEEYAIGEAVVGDINHAFKGPKNFLYGNHCDRVLRWKKNSENSKTGKEIRLPHELPCFEGYNVKTNWKEDYFMVAGYRVMHGHYHNVHAAHKHGSVYAENVIHGHTHRYQRTKVNRNSIAISLPCMADPMSDLFSYMPLVQPRDMGAGLLCIGRWWG